jgi:hypothetical protein
MKLLAIALLSLATYGQQPQLQKAAPKPETKEHRYLAAHIIEIGQQYVKRMQQSSSQAQWSALLETWRAIQVRGYAQLDHVDACTALYHRTIDKRASDLTVQETTTVKECQDLDLYPFVMSPSK